MAFLFTFKPKNSLFYSRSHLLSFGVTHSTTRCHSQSFFVLFVIVRCHWLSFTVTHCTNHPHSLSLVVTCTTRRSFPKRSIEIYRSNSFFKLFQSFCMDMWTSSSLTSLQVQSINTCFRVMCPIHGHQLSCSPI